MLKVILMIKKFLLAVTLAVTSVASFASSGLYVQGDVLASKLEAKEDGEKFKKNTGAPRIAVGKDTGNIRYQADYTYFGKIKHSEVVGSASHNAELTAHSLGFSAIYDFDTKTALTPYVGARLGLNVLNLDAKTKDTASSIETEERKTTVGAGVLGGVQYNINNQFAVNAGLEYNYLGKFEDSDTKVNQYGASIGVRYNF